MCPENLGQMPGDGYSWSTKSYRNAKQYLDLGRRNLRYMLENDWIWVGAIIDKC